MLDKNDKKRRKSCDYPGILTTFADPDVVCRVAWVSAKGFGVICYVSE